MKTRLTENDKLGLFTLGGLGLVGLGLVLMLGWAGFGLWLAAFGTLLVMGVYAKHEERKHED